MEEKILYLTASGQSLQNNTKQVFASNTVKYVGAIFSLDENWQSMDSVSAIWHTDGEPISTVLDHNGYASIPPEMLVKVAPVMVNLVGSVVENNELKERLTTFPILALRVTADALINGGETAPVTPSQFEQFVANVKADADRAEDARDEAEGFRDEAEEWADKAEQAASNAGYMFFYINEDGHLIYQRTPNTQVDFYLQNGDLYVEAI